MTKSVPPPAMTLSPEDRRRIESVESLGRAGAAGVGALIGLLDDPSWAVRRAVVAGLARAGAAALAPLAEVLVERRDNEARIAAAVDALSASGADVTDTVLALLASDAAPVICDALQVLGRRKASDSIATIARFASHSDDNVGVAAIEAMGRIGGVGTVEPLIDAARTRNFFRTFPAVDALGRTGDPRAVAPLVELLDDPFYMAEATRALGRTGQESAVAALGAVLARGDVLVRTAALALRDLRDRYEATFRDTSVLVEQLRAHVSSTVSERLVECLSGAVPSEQVAIIQLLGWIADEAAMNALIGQLARDAPLAEAAAGALRRIGSEADGYILEALRRADSAARVRLLPLVGYSASSIDAVATCLEDADPVVRVLACDALARAGKTSVVPALFHLIGDREPRVSLAAGGAIQSLGSLDTKRLALLEARSSNARARRAALRIIAYFGYPEGLSILTEAIADADESIRDAAIAGLPLIEDPQAKIALLAAGQHPHPKTRAAVMRALGALAREKAVVTALMSGLEDGDAWVRYYACQSLARLRANEAAAAVIERIADEAGQVRVAAVEAMAHFSGDAPIAALSRAASSKDEDIRRAAIMGLGQLRRPESLDILREAAVAPSPPTRLVALAALAEFASDEVVPILAHAASDPEESVQSAAIGYLSTRVGNTATRALIAQLEKPGLRDRAIAALAVAPEERIDGICSALDTADAAAAPPLVSALVRMRSASGLAAIASLLTLDNVYARRAAAAALAHMGTKEALDALARASATDPDPEVRKIGASAAR